MKFHTIMFIGFLSLMFLFPLMTKAQVLSPPAIPEAVTEEEVRQFMDQYRDQSMKIREVNYGRDN